MKPLKSLLFLLAVLSLLTAVHFGLKGLGYKGLPGWNKPQDAPVRETSPQDRWRQDSLMQLYKKVYRFPEHLPSQAWLENIPLVPFEYDTAGAGSLLLKTFFVKCLTLSQPDESPSIQDWYRNLLPQGGDQSADRPRFCRILCYGGQTLQDDRLSGNLRQLIQSDFGGSGPGLLPLSRQIPYDPEGKADLCQVHLLGPWHEIAAAGSSRRGNYGLMTAYLAPPILNILKGNDQNPDTGQVRIEIPSRLQGQGGLCLDAFVHEDVRTKDIRVSVLAANPDSNHGDPVWTLLPTAIRTKRPGQQRITYPLPQNTGSIRFQLTLKRNRNLYALALNDTTGISLDNLCLPSSQGRVFSVNNRRFLTDQLHLSNTGLIIYQAGIPKPDFFQDTSLQEEAYRQYRLQLLRELSYIRSLMPSMPVILTALPDPCGFPAEAGTDSQGRNCSGTSTERLLQIQKETAFQTACIFWSPGKTLQDSLLTDLEKADLHSCLLYKALLDAYRRFLHDERREKSIERAKYIEKRLPAPLQSH